MCLKTRGDAARWGRPSEGPEVLCSCLLLRGLRAELSNRTLCQWAGLPCKGRMGGRGRVGGWSGTRDLGFGDLYPAPHARMLPVHSFISLIIYKASQVLKKTTALCCAALSGPGLLGGVGVVVAGSGEPPHNCHFKAQDPQITQGGPGLQGQGTQLRRQDGHTREALRAPGISRTQSQSLGRRPAGGRSGGSGGQVGSGLAAAP